MDDSERSYGYSEDIYHGRRRAGGHLEHGEKGFASGAFYPDSPPRARSYEYGREQGMGRDLKEGDFAPEEAAMRIRGGWRKGGPQRRSVGLRVPEEGRPYDYGFGGQYSQVESFTWDIEGPYRGLGPRGYRRPDERIHEEVCDRLEAHGGVDASEVEVSVSAGEVTLSGTVPDRDMKRQAESAAESVRGVVDVHNRLTLGRPARPNGGKQRPAKS
jgi:hypothetical protein